MTYGRPREFDIDRALEAATQQFWSVGYEASSLQNLLQAMSLSKSSLYQTFGNKHELFILCLGHYQKKIVDELNIKLANSGSAKQFLQDFLESIIAETDSTDVKKGCFLVNTANELCQRDKLVSEAVTRATNDLAGVFRRAIEQGKRQHEFSAEIPTDGLVDYLMTSVSGLRTMIKGGAARDTLNPVINLILQTFA